MGREPFLSHKQATVEITDVAITRWINAPAGRNPALDTLLIGFTQFSVQPIVLLAAFQWRAKEDRSSTGGSRHPRVPWDNDDNFGRDSSPRHHPDGALTGSSSSLRSTAFP